MRKPTSPSHLPTATANAFGLPGPAVVFGSSYPVLGAVSLSKTRVNLGQVSHHNSGDELGEIELASVVHKDLMSKSIIGRKTTAV